MERVLLKSPKDYFFKFEDSDEKMTLTDYIFSIGSKKINLFIDGQDKGVCNMSYFNSKNILSYDVGEWFSMANRKDLILSEYKPVCEMANPMIVNDECYVSVIYKQEKSSSNEIFYSLMEYYWLLIRQKNSIRGVLEVSLMFDDNIFDITNKKIFINQRYIIDYNSSCLAQILSTKGYTISAI